MKRLTFTILLLVAAFLEVYCGNLPVERMRQPLAQSRALASIELQAEPIATAEVDTLLKAFFAKSQNAPVVRKRIKFQHKQRVISLTQLSLQRTAKREPQKNKKFWRSLIWTGLSMLFIALTIILLLRIISGLSLSNPILLVLGFLYSGLMAIASAAIGVGIDAHTISIIVLILAILTMPGAIILALGR